MLVDLGTMSPLEEFKYAAHTPITKYLKTSYDMKFDDDKNKD